MTAALRHCPVLAVIAVLAGCSAIGEKEFACPGRPPGVRCMSTKQVYQATHETDFVAPTAAEALGDEPLDSKAERDERRSGRRAPAATRSRDSSHQRDVPIVVAREVETPVADRPIPIRLPAQVMRVWIAPWEDTRGALHGGEHAFIEIRARRWSIGEPAATEPERLFSIQAPAMDAKKAVGKDSAVPPARPGPSERSASPTLPKAGASK